MREIRRIIAQLDSIADEMDRLVNGDSNLSSKKGHATFSEWRGPRADSAAREREAARKRFDALVVEGRALSVEGFRFLKSEGVDTSSREIDKAEQSLGSDPDPEDIVNYCRLIVATLRAKAQLL